jgi:hypothetical protein
MHNSIFPIAALLALAAPALAADQHLVIVSIGDSLAAGEGNPDAQSSIPGQAGWQNAPCHRSFNNGRRFASERINNLSGVSTSFFDFSCSGAKIGAPGEFLPGGGLMSPQQTTQPNVDNTLMPSQIDQVLDFQQSATGLNDRAIDILMISIGVNDVNFARIVETCLENVPGGDCTHSDAVTTGINILHSPELAADYDKLAAALRQLRVRKVYITEYPNLVKRDASHLCGLPDVGDLSMQGISTADSQFLLTNVVNPLNTVVAQAAARNGWTLVRGPKDTFVTHGFCTDLARRYVNTAQDALLRQGDTNGTMHPNIAGHKAYADALIAQATTDFDLNLETPRMLRRLEQNASTPGNVPVPFEAKKLTVEIAQHPGTLTVTVQTRVVTAGLFGSTVGPVSAAAMTDTGAGALNLFSATLPSSNVVVPGAQTLQYRVIVQATRGSQTATLTTGWFSMDGLLVQQ